MIRHLAIRNFGIISKLDVDFFEGFTAITGETGAGKSLIVNAVAQLFSPKADPSRVKPGEKEAVLEAVFDISSCPELKKMLEEKGFDPSDELIVRRVISKEGRGRVFVNDLPATARLLKEAAQLLFEIQSQRESFRVLEPSYQLLLLDRFGKNLELRREYERLYEEFSRLRTELLKFKEKKSELLRRLDYLNYVVSEIEKASPDPEEEEELQREKNKLEHAQRLRETAEEVLSLLFAENGAFDALRLAVRKLESVSAFSEEMKKTASLLDEAVIRLREAELELSDFLSGLDVSEERLNEIEARLAELSRLKMKYGPSLRDVLDFLEKARAEKAEIEEFLFRPEELSRKLSQIENELREKAHQLSEARKRAAQVLKERVERELISLGFDSPVFEVRLEPLEELSSFGAERCEFLFSANPDAEPQPLRKVASGGELSRVLLSLKLVFAEEDKVPTLFLDEVDAGIGGLTADLVGEKLLKLGESRQVICITHFPQLARRANRHMRVEKVLKDNKSFVKVSYIEGKERERELKRMMGW